MSIGTIQESIPVWRELARHPSDRNVIVLASALSRAADEVEKALARVVTLETLAQRVADALHVIETQDSRSSVVPVLNDIVATIGHPVIVEVRGEGGDRG